MNVKLYGLRLASRLVEQDTSEECPYCNKKEWGEENHESKCPFSIAYRIIEFNKSTKN